MPLWVITPDTICERVCIRMCLSSMLRVAVSRQYKRPTTNVLYAAHIAYYVANGVVWRRRIRRWSAKDQPFCIPKELVGAKLVSIIATSAGAHAAQAQTVTTITTTSHNMSSHIHKLFTPKNMQPIHAHAWWLAKPSTWLSDAHRNVQQTQVAIVLLETEPRTCFGTRSKLSVERACAFCTRPTGPVWFRSLTKMYCWAKVTRTKQTLFTSHYMKLFVIWCGWSWCCAGRAQTGLVDKNSPAGLCGKNGESGTKLQL